MRLLCLLLLISCTAFGQERQMTAPKTGRARVDSLIACIPHYGEDTNKVLLLDNISYSSYEIDPSLSIRYGNEGMRIATGLGWKKGMARLHNSLGNARLMIQDYQGARSAYEHGLLLFRQLGDSSGVAREYGNIANIYVNTGDFSLALEYDMKALAMYERLDQKGDIARITGNMGNIYAQLGNDTKALDLYTRAFNLNQSIGNKPGLAREAGHLANIWFNKGDYKKSLEYNFRSLAIWKELGSEINVAMINGNIGNAYSYRKQYDKALEYDLLACRLHARLNDLEGLSRSTANAGAVYLEMAKNNRSEHIPDSLRDKDKCYALAFTSFKEALAIALRTGNLINRKAAYQVLYEYYVDIGDYKNALEHFRMVAAINDSMTSVESQKKIAILEAKRETELKERELKIQKLELRRIVSQRYYLLGGIGLTFLFALFWYRSYRRKMKDNLIISAGKKRSDELLLNILPAEIAEELKQYGNVEASQFDEVTVMFTDFVNFTAIAERMSPKELVAELHTCFKAFDEIMSKYEIEKIKTIGDAYLAVCGLPLPSPDHARRIVLAAMEIREFMNIRRQTLGDKTLEIRIGIHSGSVVAGIVGVKKFAYDIWGDTVNTAARMEQNSEPGRINISETTHELIKDRFTCSFRGEIVAKNKGPMKMYFAERQAVVTEG